MGRARGAGWPSQAGVDAPMIRTVAQRLAQGVDAGYGDGDIAATYRLSAPGGG